MDVTVPPGLARAYRRSLYSAGDVEVSIGRRSPSMDALLRRHSARTGVFVTAWNPMSHKMPERWNRRQQKALAERLRRVPVLAASGGWRIWREDHLLALADPRLVLRVARVFRQRAVVVVGRHRPARLQWVVYTHGPVR